MMCGFVGVASNFLFFLLRMVLTNLALCLWFFALTEMAPTFDVAKPCSILSIAIYVVFAGFIVSHSRIPDCLVWLYWINPLAWCLRAVAVNQYRSPELDVCGYQGSDYCGRYNMTMGEYSYPSTTFRRAKNGNERAWFSYCSRSPLLRRLAASFSSIRGMTSLLAQRPLS